MEIRLDLAQWIPQNLEWIQSVACTLLLKKKEDFEDYLKFKVQAGHKIDQIALTLIAWVYNIHVRVLLQKRSIWTTQYNNNLSACHIVLVYLGKLTSLTLYPWKKSV